MLTNQTLCLATSLADNGGFTYTLSVSSDSFAVGNGSTTIAFDQRGYIRSTKTIGAYGYDGTAPANDIYLAAQTGYWSTADTWLVYNSTSREWETAAIAPDENSIVYITSGYDVSVASNNTVVTASVIVTATSALLVDSNASITVANSSNIGGALTVCGTYTATGNLTVSGQLTNTGFSKCK